jgi:hypothetical protein
MAAIGAIEIQLLADVARLRADMGSASSIVSGAANKMTDAFGVAKGALAALGVGLSAAGFASWIKSGIDAADSMKNFSQRTGVAVRDVAGLQLAFKQGGIESEALGTAMSRMTRNMATGADAFKTLGVATHNTDGTMRGAKEVLYDTAEALATVQGNSERVALATEVFGKAGAALLPVFENGSEGLREMAEMADKLGLSMDGEAAEAADKFNDTLELVGLSTQGVARQVGAQLLPALNGIVGAFLDFITEGDRVKKMADFIAAGLRVLYSAGVALVEVFSAVGKTVGAAIASIVAVMQGDLKGAIAIGKEWADDMKGDWSKAIQNIGSAWEESSGQTVEALARTTRVMRDVKMATDAQKESSKALAKEDKDRAKEFEKQQKDKEKLIKDEMDLQSKRALAVIASYEKEQQAVDDSITKADEMVAAILRETEALSMSNTEREISNALLALEKAGVEQGTYAYEVYAQKIREAVVNKAAVAESIEQNKQIAENWNELTTQIGQGLTDSLFRAFEAGKGFFQSLWDGIVNTFKTTVLRLVVNMVMNPINSAIGGLLGGGSSLASAATGVGSGGGILDLLSGAGSIFSGLGGALGTFGTAAGMGASALFGGTGLTALSGAGSMIGAGSLAGGLGLGLGVLGPIAGIGGALYGLYNAIKHESTPHSGGGAVSDASGTQAGAYSLVQSSMRADVNPQTQQYLAATTSTVAGMLNALAAIGGGPNVRVSAAYADDKSNDPAWGEFRIAAGDQSLVNWRDIDGRKRLFSDGQAGLAEFQAALTADVIKAAGGLAMPDWAKPIIAALGDRSTLDDLAKAVQQIQTIAAEKAQPAADTTSQSLTAPASNASMAEVREEIEEMADMVRDAIDLVRTTFAPILTSIATNSASTQRILTGWSDDDAVLTRAAP